MTKKKFKEHLQIHNESLTKEKSDKVNIEETADKAKKFCNCQKCEINFDAKSKLEKHIQCHEERSRENVQQTLECNKCDKVYGNISKLRRHDWRSHREVDCTVCGERLESRQNISQHRKDKHQMFKIAKCKFFPQCIDADECFFTHNNVPNEGETNRFSRKMERIVKINLVQSVNQII